MTKAEKKREDALNYIEKELIFIDGWLHSDPGRMEEYLRGRRGGLKEALQLLEWMKS